MADRETSNLMHGTQGGDLPDRDELITVAPILDGSGCGPRADCAIVPDVNANDLFTATLPSVTKPGYLPTRNEPAPEEGSGAGGMQWPRPPWYSAEPQWITITPLVTVMETTTQRIK